MINTENVKKLITLPPPLTTPIDVSHNSIHLPCIGRVQHVRDNQGRWMLSGIVAYWIYGSFTSYFIILEPAINDDLIPMPNLVILSFWCVSFLCLLALCRSTFSNPGLIPISSQPDENWNLCNKCNRMRPPKTHHCRRCGQCVVKMDHHCPWINNCVGEGNHFAFIQLNVYAFLLSLYALILNLLHFWVFPKCVNCDKDVFYIKHSIWFMYLLFVLAINMVVVMGGMVWNQHLNFLFNRTTMDVMFKGEVYGRSEVRKCYSAYRELCGPGAPLLWFWPLRRKRTFLPYELQDII